MRFLKMQGIGNDFVIADGFRDSEIADPGALARKICDRHFGVGADGLIWMVPSAVADARMRILNSDGSEPEMCGNGLRCAAKFLFDRGYAPADMTVETLAGVLTAHVGADGVTAGMGAPCFDPVRIPVAAAENRVEIALDGRPVRFFCVSMGNPHAVTFDLYPEGETFRRFGALVERHEAFPARMNVEFCRIRDGGIDVRVWERGDGETLACGTGACASLAAASSLGLLGREADVRLPGGTLHIRWLPDGQMEMRGPAENVFSGEFPT